MSRTRPGHLHGKSAERRSLIIAAAERLFRDIGYRKTTVADIARDLSMSAGNIYRFFASKAELNEAVAEKLMGEVDAAMQVIAERPGTAAIRLRQVIRTVAQLNAERAAIDFKLHELLCIAVTQHWSAAEDHTRRMDTLLAKIIAEGIAAGEFRPQDALLAARTLRIATLRFSQPELMTERADMLEPTLEHMLDFCLVALRSTSV